MVDTPGIRDVAPGLAPKLGLTEAQFLSVPLHPAYPGLMPAEHAGVAAAYLTAVLADEYHGEVVTGYTVLERAGVIAAAAEPTVAAEPPQASYPKTLDQAGDLCAQLQEALAQTEAEFNQLPVFIRPLARNGFKSKAGLSVGDWQRSAARLADRAQTQGLAGLRAEWLRLGPLPDRLRVYFAEVPAETARFTHDADLLRRVRASATARVRVLEALHQTLNAP
jgi:hypothetical protein